MSSILITGAGQGYGRELTEVYRSRGWTVFPLVRKDTDAARLTATGCFPIVADIATDATGEAIAAVLKARTDSLDILINNAGNIVKNRGVEKTPPGELTFHFDVHCLGALRCVQACLPFLRAATRPAIVNITSRWSSIARSAQGQGALIYGYQMAKAAQNMMTAGLHQELTPQGIRVFAVHPGRLKTSVGAPDADIDPHDSALKLADWLEDKDADEICVCHDLMEGSTVAW